MSSRKQQTRDKILNAAQRLLVERGYFGVGLEKVAKESGVSRQAVYLHFKSKAELLVALVQHVDEKVGTLTRLQQVKEMKTAVEALDEGVAGYGVMEPLIYDVARTIYDARRSDPAAEAAWQDRMAFRWQNITQRIENLQKEGLLADAWTVEEATDFVWALLSVHTYEYLVVERGWLIDQFVSHLRRVLRRTIVKEPDSRHTP